MSFYCTCLVTLSFLAICSITDSMQTFSIDYDDNTFVKDGSPFRYISGSMHYFRVPKALWKDRLYKLRKSGLNAVQTYVPWNRHEMFKGSFNFDGNLDIVSFISMAQEQGLLVILRPGPYICAEWEFGGFPYWLINEIPNGEIRTNSTRYMQLVDEWFSVLLPKMKPLLYEYSGPIIMVQVENEYGSYGCNQDYMLQMEQVVRKYLGSEVVLFTTDGAGDDYLKCGAIPSLYTTIDFGPGTDVKKTFEIQRKYQLKGPLVNSEYYTGWFDHWGEKHHTVKSEIVAESLDKMLALNASINMYMFEGGTNFDMFNGANSGYFPVTTSYSYDGPLSECGDPTKKYFAVQDIIAKYAEIPPGPQPTPSPKVAYGKVSLSIAVSFYDILDTLKNYTAHAPYSFEDVDLAVGYMLYRTNISAFSKGKMKLGVKKLHDRAIVIVDQKFQGILDRNSLKDMTIQEGTVLDIFVENEGRIGYGREMTEDAKGILSNVTLGGHTLTDWKMFPFGYTKDNPRMLKDVTSRLFSSLTPSNYPPSPLCFAGFVFQVEKAEDTFLKLEQWSKGYVIINNVLVQKFWTSAGPQKTLYIPKSVLMEGQTNSLTLFETDKVPTFKDGYIEFVDSPEFDTVV